MANEQTMEYWCSGSGSLSLDLTIEDARSASHQGSCDEDVEALSRVPYVAAQIAGWNVEELRKELDGYGAWDDEELADTEQNIQRMAWLAAGSIVDEYVMRGDAS